MAIKFVDVKPESAGKPEKAAAPSLRREPDAEALEVSVVPELPHPRPAPKERGRT